MGSNNAGKSNLLAGIRHFSALTARGRFHEQRTIAGQNDDSNQATEDAAKLRPSDLSPHRHRLLPRDTPMSFSCLWSNKGGNVEYFIELFDVPRNRVGCRESISIEIENAEKKEIKVGWDEIKDRLTLRATVQTDKSLTDKQKELADIFFKDMSSCYLYDFQPSFLSGQVSGNSPNIKDDEPLRIAAHLGIQGGNLQQILARIQQTEPTTYNNFLTKLQRFEKRFRGLRYDEKREQPMWLFDLGKEEGKSDEFPPDFVSGGTLRAAAIALLCSMQNPPGLMLLEEIENGINQVNLGDFLRWILQAAGTPNSAARGYRTQFIVTTHSPSVLREFADHLDEAYNVRLETKGHKSVVIDINSFLSSLVNMGTVEGDFEKKNGKEVVKVAPDKITELWYSGIIGGR
jgi:predicted ATPase